MNRLWLLLVGIGLAVISYPRLQTSTKEWFTPHLETALGASVLSFSNTYGILFDQTYESIRVGSSAITFYQNGNPTITMANGTVGIGTTTSDNNLLKVEGGISLGNDLINGKRYIGLTNPSNGTDLSTFHGMVLTSNANNSLISFYTSSSERLRIDSYGNVFVNSYDPIVWNPYRQPLPPTTTFVIGGGLIANRPVYLRASSFSIVSSNGTIVSPTLTPYTSGSVYYFKPTVTSTITNWTPQYKGAQLMIPYSGLYMIQLNVGGSPLIADVFISKNTGDGSEPASTTGQVLAINSMNGVEGMVTTTTYLSSTDLLTIGCILGQNSMSLSSNKCWLSATLLQQTA